MTLKLKVRVVTKADQVLIHTVEVSRLDVQVVVKKAVLSLGLDIRHVREATIL